MLAHLDTLSSMGRQFGACHPGGFLTVGDREDLKAVSREGRLRCLAQKTINFGEHNPLTCGPHSTVPSTPEP